nr:DUF3263 domain-containing protein [Allostreptomyces psammosilenae]
MPAGAAPEEAEPTKPEDAYSWPGDGPGAGRPGGDGLGAVERAVLEFERGWWRRPGAKDQAIRERLELSPTRYYQLLNGLLDRPEALREYPVVVGRLRRLREERRRRRG